MKSKASKIFSVTKETSYTCTYIVSFPDPTLEKRKGSSYLFGLAGSGEHALIWLNKARI